jgi:hypothetical protein
MAFDEGIRIGNRIAIFLAPTLLTRGVDNLAEIDAEAARFFEQAQVVSHRVFAEGWAEGWLPDVQQIVRGHVQESGEFGQVRGTRDGFSGFPLPNGTGIDPDPGGYLGLRKIG